MNSCVLIPTVYIQIEKGFLLDVGKFDKVMYLFLHPYFNKIIHLYVMVNHLTPGEKNIITKSNSNKMVYIRSVGQDRILITWHPRYFQKLIHHFSNDPDVILWGESIVAHPMVFSEYI